MPLEGSVSACVDILILCIMFYTFSKIHPYKMRHFTFSLHIVFLLTADLHRGLEPACSAYRKLLNISRNLDFHSLSEQHDNESFPVSDDEQIPSATIEQPEINPSQREQESNRLLIDYNSAVKMKRQTYCA